jgi:hypothetical protein
VWRYCGRVQDGHICLAGSQLTLDPLIRKEVVNVYATIKEIAVAENINRSYVGRVLR